MSSTDDDKRRRVLSGDYYDGGGDEAVSPLVGQLAVDAQLVVLDFLSDDDIQHFRAALITEQPRPAQTRLARMAISEHYQHRYSAEISASLQFNAQTRTLWQAAPYDERAYDNFALSVEENARHDWYVPYWETRKLVEALFDAELKARYTGDSRVIPLGGGHLPAARRALSLWNTTRNRDHNWLAVADAMLQREPLWTNVFLRGLSMYDPSQDDVLPAFPVYRYTQRLTLHLPPVQSEHFDAYPHAVPSIVRALVALRELTVIVAMSNNNNQRPRTFPAWFTRAPFTERVQLDRLELYNVNVEALPEDLHRHRYLRRLTVDGSPTLDTVPPLSLGRLDHLEVLYFSYNSALRSLPALLFADAAGVAMPVAHSLRELHLLGNQVMTTLPTSIGALTALAELNIKSSAITQLPVEIGRLHALVVLRATATPLRELPDVFHHMHVLRHVHLDYCSQLERLPPSLGAAVRSTQVASNNAKSRVLSGRTFSFGGALPNNDAVHIDVYQTLALRYVPSTLRDADFDDTLDWNTVNAVRRAALPVDQRGAFVPYEWDVVQTADDDDTQLASQTL